MGHAAEWLRTTPVPPTPLSDTTNHQRSNRSQARGQTPNHIDTMTTAGKLKRIRARCEELLAMVEKCAPCDGTGRIAFNPNLNPSGFPGTSSATCPHCGGTGNHHGFTGHEDAGWRSTIAAIDGLRSIERHNIGEYGEVGDIGVSDCAGSLRDAILAAWPDELFHDPYDTTTVIGGKAYQ